VVVGDEVSRGQPLVILEAMKMQNEIAAPADGTVEAVFVRAGQAVASGAKLLALV
jgi:biotin carboxyl carrier protein